VPDMPAYSALLTDLYELTMACGYWRSGRADTEACFHVIFRSQPFDGGFSIAAGLANAVEYLRALHFAEDDLAYLGTLTGADGSPLFDREFLGRLRDFEFACDVRAVPEGTVVFPNEPLVRVVGPLWQAQLVETALLNIINFQTLIATKAARVVRAAGGGPVIEFGLRRAQGPDGGVSASRAAYVGGCDGTSNVLAGKRFGIPVRGTHAHSWVMTFDTEIESFDAYAQSMPNNCVFLVDTYDTLEGVRHAVEAGRRLREAGHEMVGIRIDSGDLAWLSKRAREILDDGGFPNAKIMASNELDEHLVASLREQGARIDTWGVGTKLATAHDDPALGGVYKLAAVREPGGAVGEREWQPRIKLSEETAKINTPGLLGVRRFSRDGRFVGDMVWDELHPPGDGFTIVDPADPIREKSIQPEATAEELLVPVLGDGAAEYVSPPLQASRDRTFAQLAMLDESHKRFLNPHRYPVGLEAGLYDERSSLIVAARQAVEREKEGV